MTVIKIHGLSGTVYCWDEVDASKGNRAGPDKCLPHRVLETLRKHEIVKVYSAKHFNAVISKNGLLFTW